MWLQWGNSGLTRSQVPIAAQRRERIFVWTQLPAGFDTKIHFGHTVFALPFGVIQPQTTGEQLADAIKHRIGRRGQVRIDAF
jgi:hypothetical protein